MKDKDPNVRFKAAVALGASKDSRALEPLVAALKDENLNVRIYIPRALGQLKDSRAIEPLIATLKDKDFKVQYSAAMSLMAILDRNSYKNNKEIQKWWEENKERLFPNK